MRRSLAVTALAVAAVGLGSSPAYAHEGEEHPPPPGGEWVPADPAFYAEPISFEACGSTVTMSAGDVFELEERFTPLPNGGARTEFRGEFTVDLVRESDGAMIDELDIGGPGYEVTRFDGDEVHLTNKLYGESVMFPFSPEEAQVFEEAGIPQLAYFEEGNVELEIVFNEATGELVSFEFDEVDANIVDLCPLFDEHDDEGHGD